MKFSIKDFSSTCDQIRSFLRIWSHSLKKSLMENLIFCAVRLSSDIVRLANGDLLTNHFPYNIFERGARSPKKRNQVQSQQWKH